MENKIITILKNLNEVAQLISPSINIYNPINVTITLPKEELDMLRRDIVDHFSKTGLFITDTKINSEIEMKLSFKKFITSLGVQLILKEKEDGE